MTPAEIIQGVRARGGHFVIEGDRVKFRGASSLMTPKLVDQLRRHREPIMRLLASETALVSELDRLHETVVKLRCTDPPKGSRSHALAWLGQAIEKLAARSVQAGGTESGWYDPDDEFADWDQLAGLRVALAELEAGPYPIPLPEGCTLLPQANFNPFEHGRLYNGMVSATATYSANGSADGGSKDGRGTL